MFPDMPCVVLDMRVTGDWVQPPESRELEMAMVRGDKYSTRQAGQGVYGFIAPVYGSAHLPSGDDLLTHKDAATSRSNHRRNWYHIYGMVVCMGGF